MARRAAARTLSVPFLPAILCLATAGSLASQQPWTEIDVDPAVLEAVALVYRMASVEIVFCIEGRYDTPSDIYHIDRLVIAPQTDNCTDGAHFDCTGYDGWVHNHRGRGDRLCRMSETDLATLRGSPDLVLALGWCRAGGWFHAFDIRAAEQAGP
jgi:hypothetical protein